MNDRTVVRRLREQRKNLGLTQAEMAKKLGVWPGYYAGWEAGKNLRSVRFAYRFIAVCAEKPRLRLKAQVEHLERGKWRWWLHDQHGRVRGSGEATKAESAWRAAVSLKRRLRTKA